MTTSTAQPHNLNPRGAAEYLNLRAGTLANWRSAGKGPAFIRVGGAIRYSTDSLDAWLKANTIGTLDQAA